MVKKLSIADRALLDQAVTKAEQTTDAEFAVVIARMSDEYRAIALLIGLVLGCVVALLLAHLKLVTTFPQLLIAELVVCLIVLIVSPLRHLSIRLTPKSLLHRRSGERAMAEYVRLTDSLPSHVPVVLLYVSLAERFAHIYTSRLVREKIPQREWQDVVKLLTGHVDEHGVAAAIVKAVEAGAGKLQEAFPLHGRTHNLANVTEI